MIETILIIAILAALIYRSRQNTKGFPPGPIGLPIIGYYPFLDFENPHNTWQYLSERYGNVCGAYFGGFAVVLCNGYEACKEAFLNDDLIGRPDVCFTRDRFDGNKYGVAFIDGEFWKKQRRFTLHHFRNLGFGKRSHESVILEEAKELIKELKETSKAINYMEPLGKSTINILWALLGGKRFNRKNPDLEMLFHSITETMEHIQVTGGVAVALPFLRYIFPESTGYKSLIEGTKGTRNFTKKAIEEHKKTFDPENLRDFIDIYLKEMYENNDPSFTDDQLEALCMDLLAGGVDTTSSVLSFALLFMCLYPDLQAKIHNEMDSVMDQDRLPNLNDRSRLVLTDATLLEVLRYRNPAPTTIPHRAVKTTQLKNHIIPEGAIVLIHLRSIMMEESHWKDPENFRPERFITEEGTLKKDERMIPFGKGKRACIGESLARMTSYLIFSALVHTFKFSLEPGVKVTDTSGHLGFTLAPPNYKIIATPRF